MGIAGLGGQRRDGATPARTAPPTGRPGGTSSKRRWRATGPAAATGSNTYRQQYGASATPLPIQSWQIWNEPNLKKYFTPGENVNQSAQKYAELLQISHDAITSQDPKAEIVLAGMPGYGDSKAWVFLDHLYEVPGVKERLRRHRPAPLRA